MSETKPLPKDRIGASFKQLNSVAASLNSSVRELGKSIESLEESLACLNLGVSAWHQIAGDEDDDGLYWSRDIGYTQIRSKWRIALRTSRGHNGYNSHNEDVWPFIDAPRWMCIEAASKLPDLFEILIKRSEEITEKVNARIPETEDLAGTVRGIREEFEAAKSKKARKLS